MMGRDSGDDNYIFIVKNTPVNIVVPNIIPSGSRFFLASLKKNSRLFRGGENCLKKTEILFHFHLAIRIEL